MKDNQMKVTVTFEASNADELLRIQDFAASEFSPAPAATAVSPAPPLAAPAAVPPVVDVQGVIPAPAVVAPAAVAPLAGVLPIVQPHDLTDIDADGFPWDERIHQVAKTKTAKNKWKVLKGLGTKHPGLREQVEAELKAAYPATATVPASTIIAPPPPAATAPVAPLLGALPEDPTHRAIVERVTAICATRPEATARGIEHYGLQSTEHGQQVLEFLKVWGCGNINDVATVPHQWEGLLQGLEYVWPQ